MKYLVKNIIASTTLASMVVSGTLSNINNVYASELNQDIVSENEVTEDTTINLDIVDATDNLDVEKGNSDIEEVTEEDYRDMDNFTPITPVVPPIIEEDYRDMDNFTPITPVVPPIIEEDDRDMDNFTPITPVVPPIIEENDRDIDNFTPITPDVTPIVDPESMKMILSNNIQLTSTSVIPEEYFKFNPATGTLLGMDYDNYSDEIYLAVAENNGVLEIPSTINGVDVTVIGQSSFEGSTFEKILLPDSIKKIGSSAFAKSSLTEFTIPNSVEHLGGSALRYSPNLADLTIGTGIKYIDSYTFSNLPSLKFVEIPSNVTDISQGAFANSGLEKIVLNEGLKFIGPNVFQDCRLTGELIIPSTVEEIIWEAFINTSGYNGEYLEYTQMEVPERGNEIESVIFLEGENGSQLKFIDEEAFANNKIKKLVLPNKAIQINILAFYNNNITSVVTPEIIPSVYNYDYMVFAQNPLEFVEVGEGTTYIPANTFTQSASRSSFYNFHSPIVPDIYTDLPFIEEYAQSVDSTLKELILPSTITSIGFNSIPVPKYAITSKSETPYSMYSQTSTIGKPNGNFQHMGMDAYGDFEYTSESVFGTLDDDEAFIDGRYSKNWSADRLHTAPAEFFSSTTNVYPSSSAYPVSGDYYVVGDVYKNYDVNIVELPEGITFDLENSQLTQNATFSEDGSTLKGKSFMTPEELIAIVENCVPVKGDLEFSHWDFSGLNTSENSGYFEYLKLDTDSFNPYVVADISGIVPVFKEAIETETAIALTTNMATQKNLYQSNKDSKISIEVSNLLEGQEFTIDLDDTNYAFVYDETVNISALNENSNFTFVSSEFEETSSNWQYRLINDNKTILIKSPTTLSVQAIDTPITIVINNLGVKDADGVLYGGKDETIVNVVLSTNTGIVDSQKIAEFVFNSDTRPTRPITPSKPIVETNGGGGTGTGGGNNYDDNNDREVTPITPPVVNPISPTNPTDNNDEDILFNIDDEDVPLGIGNFDTVEDTIPTEYYTVDEDGTPLGTFENKVNPKTGDATPLNTSVLALLLAGASISTLSRKRKNIK